MFGTNFAHLFAQRIRNPSKELSTKNRLAQIYFRLKKTRYGRGVIDLQMTRIV